VKQVSRERVGAVIAAAGSSRRMDGIDKIFTLLAGKPLLWHVLQVFQECGAVDQVVVVLGEASVHRGVKLVEEGRFSKVLGVCPGGRRRQDSVAKGLERLEGCDWVVVHDGARPCLTVELVERGLKEARRTGAAIAAVPLKETVKVVGADGLIESTPRRESLWAAQTPQVFRFDLIVGGYRNVSQEVTDDASLVEAVGQKVRVYMGLHDNIKVTTPEDLVLAETILRMRDESRRRL
jgi:2-C-methyl-D-erythritol 4-phosphate cytidylyltransferase